MKGGGLSRNGWLPFIVLIVRMAAFIVHANNKNSA